MKALVTVGGFAFPEPSTYKGMTETIVDGARNVKGEFIGAVIREDVAKVEITWKYLTADDWAMVLSCFKGKNFVNMVEFFDQSTGRYQTRKMYVGNRDSNMWRRHHETGEVMGWTDCRLALIEV